MAEPYRTGDDILDATRDFVRLVQEAESENRREAELDLDYLVGEGQWESQVRQGREAAQRPCLTLNEIPTFTAQITNDYKQNPPGVLVHPADADADVKTAEVIEGMGRDIFYESSGQAADEIAFQSAVYIGWGYFRLYTEYVSDTSFDQEILLGSLPNTFAVFFDPYSKTIDGSDATECVILDKMRRQEFERVYPGAEAVHTSLLDQPGMEEWLTVDSVSVAEKYCLDYVADTLYLVGPGQTVLASQLEAQPQLQAIVQQLGGVRQERAIQRRLVKWYKCTAVDVLDERTLPGVAIPVVPVYGNLAVVRGKKVRWGLIRFLRDPQRMLNYWETTKTELLALQPRAPWVGPEGFMGAPGSSQESAWRYANSSNVVALEYSITDMLGNPSLLRPERVPFPTPPPGVIEAAAQAEQYMRKISGINQPAELTPGSSRSGRSLQQEEQQADMATFHYFRNAQASRLQAWRIIMSWLPTYYSAERVVQILGEDGRSKTVTINAVQQTGEVLHNLRTGQYNVVLASGPDYQTKRQEAVAGMVDIGQAFPKLWEVAGSAVVRNLDWPGADEIAKKLAASEPQLPGEEADAAQALPRVLGQLQQVQQQAQALNAHAEQVEQQAQQLTQENQQLKAQLATKQGELQVKQAELVVKQQELRLEEQKLALEARKAQMDYELAVAKQAMERDRLQTEQAQVRAPERNGTGEEVEDES